MVRRRVRRRRRLRRRTARMSRRYVSRSRRFRRRMLRRRGRRSRGLTVSCRREYPLVYSSFIPDVFVLYGSEVGARQGEFYSWSVNILPNELVLVPGNTITVGKWAIPTVGAGGATGLLTRTLGGNDTGNWWTDMPICVRSDTIFKALNAENLWKMHTEYRVRYISVTLTVPENTNGARNHHLYVEWSHLPHALAATFDSVRGESVPPNPTASTSGRLLNFNAGGWNWLCRPKDVGEACSIDGHDNKRFGWKRAQLNYGRPVTIRWRPRHAKINFDHGNYVDYFGSAAADHDIKLYDNYAVSRKLTRSYLPTEIDVTDINQQHWWLGPVVRILDADNARGVTTSSYEPTLYDNFGIRCTFSMSVKLRGLKANDPIFPKHNE